jgi:hypothetical protein
MRQDLLTRELRKPGVTAAAYRKSSLALQERLPSVYKLARAEVRFVHEVYIVEGLAAAGIAARERVLKLEILLILA